MVGIFLTLLMIGAFMTPPFDCGAGPYIPRVAHPVTMYRAERAGAVRIAITRDGQFYLGGDRTDKTHIVNDLKARLSQGAEAKIYIEADARARYKSVSEVLDAARSAGIYQVAFLVEQLKNVKY